MSLIYLVQHGEKQPEPGDPGLTDRGRWQADCAARLLRDAGITSVFSSPLLRAAQTAERIAAVAGLGVTVDDRLRERMNWDGHRPIGEFLIDWSRSVRERDFVPAGGYSSHQAAERMRAFLTEAAPAEPIAVVTHGGITVDLLRSLLGDAAVPARLLHEGVPSAAITTIDGFSVVRIAATTHLDELPRRGAR
ncbi:broad specificity phosphatase PhoE [Allocatelliglobosispora scoriae]|uniref:Broad specificity phosphatase PhoE n=1 Tax=Allocatelliglobosispora scoriae TaxID=643052 RepID=A0A841BZ82_9ACTN|nr:histidine phosphatase family protein [Allocatelliglobosispora scoriae]MBB5872896.1 broad specificity phosphatase PhoE [Allocatelliglobosispora scoriae]